MTTLAFVAGFSLVFVTAGAGAAFVGSALLRYERTLQIVAGLLLILFGLAVAGALPDRILSRERRALPFRPPRGIFGAGLTGIAFSLAWTPCAGPILASILTIAASGSHPVGGALLLLVYSLGLGIPFVLFGLLFAKLVSVLEWAKRHHRPIQIVSGGLLALYGLLIVFGQLGWLSSLLGGRGLFDI
jgi:cytochrome c-type biogenesis protein